MSAIPRIKCLKHPYLTSFPTLTTQDITFIRASATNSTLPTSVVIMPLSILFVFWTWLSVDNLTTTFSAVLPFGGSKDRFKTFYSTTKRNINSSNSGLGGKKIYSMEILKEAITNCALRNLNNLPSSGIMNSLNCIRSLGSFSMKTYWWARTKGGNWIR